MLTGQQFGSQVVQELNTLSSCVQIIVENNCKFPPSKLGMLPLIFNSSIALFNSLIKKNSLFEFSFGRNPFIVPRLFVTYFFISQQELIWFMSYLYKMEGTFLCTLIILYFIEYVIIFDWRNRFIYQYITGEIDLYTSQYIIVFANKAFHKLVDTKKIKT